MLAPIYLAIASLAALASAQNVGVGNQTIVPTSVDVNTRTGWCVSEKNTCNTLCSKDWTTNDCSTEDLTYNCTCADGSSPDLVEYMETLPYFICQEYIAQCVAGNATEPDLQDICRNTNTCGMLDPADFVATTTAKTTAPATTSSGSKSTGTAAQTTTSSSTSATSSSNAARINEPGSAGLMRMMALVAALGLAGAGLVL